MIIVNQKRTEAYTFDHITNMYISENNKIKVAADQTRGGIIGEYSTYSKAIEAFNNMVEHIGRGDTVVYMPQDEDIIIHDIKYHNINGKKTKGHGGS